MLFTKEEIIFGPKLLALSLHIHIVRSNNRNVSLLFGVYYCMYTNGLTKISPDMRGTRLIFTLKRNQSTYSDHFLEFCLSIFISTHSLSDPDTQLIKEKQRNPNQKLRNNIWWGNHSSQYQNNYNGMSSVGPHEFCVYQADFS